MMQIFLSLSLLLIIVIKRYPTNPFILTAWRHEFDTVYMNMLISSMQCLFFSQLNIQKGCDRGVLIIMHGLP